LLGRPAVHVVPIVNALCEPEGIRRGIGEDVVLKDGVIGLVAREAVVVRDARAPPGSLISAEPTAPPRRVARLERIRDGARAPCSGAVLDQRVVRVPELEELVIAHGT